MVKDGWHEVPNTTFELYTENGKVYRAMKQSNGCSCNFYNPVPAALYQTYWVRSRPPTG